MAFRTPRDAKYGPCGITWGVCAAREFLPCCLYCSGERIRSGGAWGWAGQGPAEGLLE